MLRSVTCAFASVDQSGRREALADYLRTIGDMDVMRHGKREAIAALELRPGARVLDVGCGVGDDVRARADLVAPGGLAVGIDASAAFVAEAIRLARGTGVPADFVLGDAHRLPWADATFDAVRTERTLQHVDDPARALSEMVRVATTGALVTVSEPDWTRWSSISNRRRSPRGSSAPSVRASATRTWAASSRA
jgi:ubiquinone/menaquinone biosynthesis C-methylase UbiE